MENAFEGICPLLSPLHKGCYNWSLESKRLGAINQSRHNLSSVPWARCTQFKCVLPLPFPSYRVFPTQKCQSLIFKEKKRGLKWCFRQDNSARRAEGENQARVQKGNNSRDGKHASINQQPCYFWILRSLFPTKSLSVPEKLPLIKPCAVIQDCDTVQYTCAILFMYLKSNCVTLLLVCQQYNPSLRTDMPGWVNAVKVSATQPQKVHRSVRESVPPEDPQTRHMIVPVPVVPLEGAEHADPLKENMVCTNFF